MASNWITATLAPGVTCEVSEDGRVRGSDGRRLRLDMDPRGYLRVRFGASGKIRARVHRLIATAFVPNPLGKPQVNHIDGNKRNNAASNLEWCTPRENQRHAITSGLRDIRKSGAIVRSSWPANRKHPVRLSASERLRLYERYGQGREFKQLAAEFGVSLRTAVLIVEQHRPETVAT